MRYFYGLLVVVACALFVMFGMEKDTEVTLPIEQRGYYQNDLLVSVDWTKEHLKNEDVLILDARAEDDYNKEHIEGAISTPWQVFSNMKAAHGEGFTTLLDITKLNAKFQKLGIDDKKTIVVYANPDGWGEDGRIVWMLRMAGLNNTKILDGGWPAWEKAKGAVSDTKTISTPTNNIIPQMNEEMLATTDWIVKNRDDIKVVDTRATVEWFGATAFGESRGGHIKDAIHIQWSDLFNGDDTIKTQAAIEAIMNESGISKDDTIVLYCTAGIRSAHMTLMLKMAGYTKAKNYAASIYEWSAISELPMEK